MNEPVQLRDRCVVAIKVAIADIATAGREPDLWERVHLVMAISMLFRGAYRLGVVDADKALVPPEKRSPNPNLPNDAFYARCDLTLLRAALAEAEAEPARDWPEFGPVVFQKPPH